FLDSSDRYHAGIFQAFRAGLLATVDRVDESVAAFADADRILGEIGARLSSREGLMYRAFLDLAHARKALQDGDRLQATAHRDEALRKLAAAEANETEALNEAGEAGERAPYGGSFASAAARSRIAQRMLRAYPWPKVVDSGSPDTAAARDAPPIEADPEGNWF